MPAASEQGDRLDLVIASGAAPTNAIAALTHLPRFGAQLQSLLQELRRAAPRSVPADRGPAWPGPVAVIAPTGSLTATGWADEPHTETLEIAAAGLAVVGASAARTTWEPAGRRSIKGGPPKAPRRRSMATRAPDLHGGALALPADAVPVMAEVPARRETMDPAAALSVPQAIVEAPTIATPHKRWMSEMLQDPAVERARSTQAQRIGDDGERLAALSLEALGWRIVARNLRVSRAEIDVLAIDPSAPPSLVLVEVRRRNRRDFGLPEETVDHRKRAALLRAAGELEQRRRLPDGRRLPELPVRIDLIAIDRGRDGRPSLRHHRGIDV